jgi:AcrR family transcriptional regulator
VRVPAGRGEGVLSLVTMSKVSDAAVPRRRPPGRPRNPEAERRILDAAIDEYLERGSAGFTIDGVARRASVGKSTVYLRWPDRDALLVESIIARSRGIEDVDTGSFRDDLVQLTTNLMRFLLDPIGFATLQITVDAVSRPAYHQVAQKIADLHRIAAQRVVDRAVARGEIPPPRGDDASFLNPGIECLYGAVIVKVLAHGLDSTLEGEDAVSRAAAETVDLLFPLIVGHSGE